MSFSQLSASTGICQSGLSCVNTEGLHSVCHTLHITRAQAHTNSVSPAVTWPDSLIWESWFLLLGPHHPPAPLCVPALFFPYLYFPCGDVRAGSELRRCETDDGEDKRGLCAGPLEGGWVMEVTVVTRGTTTDGECEIMLG